MEAAEAGGGVSHWAPGLSWCQVGALIWEVPSSLSGGSVTQLFPAFHANLCGSAWGGFPVAVHPPATTAIPV